eukprot:scaffold334398_cov149-Cyclotella_meneghiniana.AAC.1
MCFECAEDHVSVVDGAAVGFGQFDGERRDTCRRFGRGPCELSIIDGLACALGEGNVQPHGFEL